MLGDFELNRIYQTDCLDGMKLLPNGTKDIGIDVTITSPPYDDLRNYKGYSFDFENVAKELYRITKDGGVVVWVVGDSTVKGSESGTSFKQALYFMEVGFNLHDTMIYKKNTASFPARRDGIRYSQIFEYMFIFSKGKPKSVNLICDKPNKWAGSTNWGKNTQRGKDNDLKETTKIKPVPEFSPRNNMWEYVVGGGFASTDKIAYEHPAIFPEKLASDHIVSWSNEGDLIFNPFMGSGTTAKMATLTNRKWLGFEISKDYVEITNKRLDNLELTNKFE